MLQRVAVQTTHSDLHRIHNSRTSATATLFAEANVRLLLRLMLVIYSDLTSYSSLADVKHIEPAEALTL